MLDVVRRLYTGLNEKSLIPCSTIIITQPITTTTTTKTIIASFEYNAQQNHESQSNKYDDNYIAPSKFSARN